MFSNILPHFPPRRSLFTLDSVIPVKGGIEAGFLEEEALSRAWDGERRDTASGQFGPRVWAVWTPDSEEGSGRSQLFCSCVLHASLSCP